MREQPITVPVLGILFARAASACRMGKCQWGKLGIQGEQKKKILAVGSNHELHPTKTPRKMFS